MSDTIKYPELLALGRAMEWRRTQEAVIPGVEFLRAQFRAALVTANKTKA